MTDADDTDDADGPGDRPRRLVLAVVAVAVGAIVQLAGGGSEPSGTDGSAPAAAEDVDGSAGATQPSQDPESEPDRAPQPPPEPDGPSPELISELEDVWCWARDTGESQGSACAEWIATSEAGPITHLATHWRRVVAADAAGVTGIDAANGTRLWRWESPAAPAQMTAAGERLVVVDTDGRLVALDATFGIPMWDVDVPDWLGVSVHGDAVAVRESASLTLYAGDDGAVRWSVDLQVASGDATPLLTDDLVVVSVDSRLHHAENRHTGLRAYARESGTEVWRSSFVPTQPMLHWPGDDLLLVAGDEVLAALEVATGMPVWTQALEFPRQVVDLDAMTVALLRPARVDVVERATGEEIASLESPSLRHVRPAGTGRLLADAGRGVQYLDIERAGIGWRAGVAWQGRAPLPHEPPFVLTEGVPGGNHVVLALGEGTMLLAFRSFTDAPTAVDLPPGCEDAQPSWALGDHDHVWRGDRVHLRLDGRELWIGIDGAELDTSFTVSADADDRTASALFGRFDGTLLGQLQVPDGARLAAGYPPHWVIEAEFDQPGCWQVHLTGDDLDETVLLPVPAATQPLD